MTINKIIFSTLLLLKTDYKHVKLFSKYKFKNGKLVMLTRYWMIILAVKIVSIIPPLLLATIKLLQFSSIQLSALYVFQGFLN